MFFAYSWNGFSATSVDEFTLQKYKYFPERRQKVYQQALLKSTHNRLEYSLAEQKTKNYFAISEKVCTFAPVLDDGYRVRNRPGKMPEWSIGAVSKTVDLLAGSQGSNPCLSANRKRSCQFVAGDSFLIFNGLCFLRFVYQHVSSLYRDRDVL